MKTPILFLVFNRPDTTRKVFAEIRNVRPPRLYISADGPRLKQDGEAEKVSQVRKLIQNGIDWECEVHTLFRDQNLGCRGAVSSGITWFFEQEEEGIILEDDCIPDRTFFRYCEELLERYRCDSQMMTISGNNFLFGRKRTPYSYYFSRYPHIWGWATWRRAWKLFDTHMENWPKLREGQWLYDIFRGDEYAVFSWDEIFQSVYTDEINSWAYIWTLSSWMQNGLAITPDRNLVSNIGFGSTATHTKSKANQQANVASEPMTFPLKHPPFIIRDVKADEITERTVFGNTPLRRWYKLVRTRGAALKRSLSQLRAS